MSWCNILEIREKTTGGDENGRRAPDLRNRRWEIMGVENLPLVDLNLRIPAIYLSVNG